ncbi:hypothetical protein Nepgr_029917 [Nepenthes gracilis]|uniref:Uncharacterized protein n=1 Tax=Nepenthes gracilis TaxID=150966 RepID=A0AAD3TF75_NEPGR|nr:hypothetical protein Nepgr_029917 [Nepenthes gracilis]
MPPRGGASRDRWLPLAGDCPAGGDGWPFWEHTDGLVCQRVWASEVAIEKALIRARTLFLARPSAAQRDRNDSAHLRPLLLPSVTEWTILLLRERASE